MVSLPRFDEVCPLEQLPDRASRRPVLIWLAPNEDVADKLGAVVPVLSLEGNYRLRYLLADSVRMCEARPRLIRCCSGQAKFLQSLESLVPRLLANAEPTANINDRFTAVETSQDEIFLLRHG